MRTTRRAALSRSSRRAFVSCIRALISHTTPSESLHTRRRRAVPAATSPTPQSSSTYVNLTCTIVCEYVTRFLTHCACFHFKHEQVRRSIAHGDPHAAAKAEARDLVASEAERSRLWQRDHGHRVQMPPLPPPPRRSTRQENGVLSCTMQHWSRVRAQVRCNGVCALFIGYFLSHRARALSAPSVGCG